MASGWRVLAGRPGRGAEGAGRPGGGGAGTAVATAVTCALHVHVLCTCMLRACAPSVHCTFSARSLHAHCACTAVRVHGQVPCMCRLCSAAHPCYWMCPECTLGAHCSGRWRGGVGLSAAKRIPPGAVPSAVRQRTKGTATGGPVAFLAPHASPCGNGWATTALCCCRRRPALALDRPSHGPHPRDSTPSELKVCSAAAVHRAHRRRRKREKRTQGGVCVGGATGVPGEG